MTGIGRRARIVLVSALLAASGCSSGDNESDEAVPSPVPGPVDPSASSEITPSPQTWSMKTARVDRVPSNLAHRKDSALPARFPAADSVVPDVLANPPGRAVLAYHPREFFIGEASGWASERIYFFGQDRTWRSMDMSDLGIPESAHPGPDTYGPGELSADGTRWVGKTNAGVVIIDLRSGETDIVTLPGEFTAYTGWRPDGRRLDVVRGNRAAVLRTLTIDTRSLEISRAPYDMPINGYARDGSMVVFTRDGGEMVRSVYRGGTRESETVPLPHQHAGGGVVAGRRTAFRLPRGLLVVDTESSAPIARLGFDASADVNSFVGWWNPDTLWFCDSARGLLTWDTTTGEVRSVTRAPNDPSPQGYWTATIADALTT